jgi:hypothetical protein
MATIYADEVNYWKTSTTSPESWIEKTKKLIAEIGGKVHSDLIGTINGKTAVMIGFEIAGDQYKIIYTVLAVRDQRDLLAAKRQAVTAIIVSAKFRGIRGAFHSYLVLPDGRTAGELTAPEVAQAIPTAFLLPPPR